MFRRRIPFKRPLIIGLILLLGVCLCLLFVSLVFVFLPILLLFGYNDHAFNKKYKAYLQTLNGTHFFCYNNRANTKDFIETQILPHLAADIHIIYLDGRTPKSDFEQQFISKVLYSIKNRKGFPYLLKISDGEIIDRSVNNEVYNTMNQNKDIEQLVHTIHSFFQTV